MSLRESFRAYELHGYGDCLVAPVLNPKATLAPLEPTQVLVRVASCATNPVDTLIIEVPGAAARLLPAEKHPPTASNPLRIGCDFAGTVVQVGTDVGEGSFQVGDTVYGFTRFDAMGSFAEYLAVDTDCIAHKPACLTFNEAAAVPLVAETSYQALVDCGKTKKNERVLILGASGGTGVFAVQIAKALGAYVVATTSSRNAEFVKSLGADEVVDYTSQNWAKVLPPHSIDVLYDCGAEPNCWNGRAQQVLKPQTGRFVSIGWMVDPIESPIGAT